MNDPPFLVLAINDSRLFQFAQNHELIDLNRPMVLDSFFGDFESKKTENVLKTIGGKATRKRRR